MRELTFSELDVVSGADSTSDAITAGFSLAILGVGIFLLGPVAWAAAGSLAVNGAMIYGLHCSLR